MNSSSSRSAGAPRVAAVAIPQASRNLRPVPPLVFASTAAYFLVRAAWGQAGPLPDLPAAPPVKAKTPGKAAPAVTAPAAPAAVKTELPATAIAPVAKTAAPRTAAPANPNLKTTAPADATPQPKSVATELKAPAATTAAAAAATAAKPPIAKSDAAKSATPKSVTAPPKPPVTEMKAPAVTAPAILPTAKLNVVKAETPKTVAAPPKSAPKSALTEIKAPTAVATVAKLPAPKLDGGKSDAAKTAAPSPAPAATTEVLAAKAGADPASATLLAGPADTEKIAINIDGRIVEADPAPVLQRGAVLVPLRGVLEKMGAIVMYDAADRRIDIEGHGRKAVLRVGQSSAIVDVRTVALSAPPQSIDGATYVPLRSLAEIFGYTVNWFPSAKTVAIYTPEGVVKTSSNHREVLNAAGRFGVNIDFRDASTADVIRLLDAAKTAGAGLIRTRFDWNTLEPTRGAAFQWEKYDRVVREARSRGLVVTGVLGDSAHWASVYSNTSDDYLKTYGPPRESEMAAWQNYVKRTVGRYGNDVHQWQIWDRASANTFRSGQKVYFQILALAVDAARKSDPKSILVAGEPGGVDLGWTELLASLPVGKSIDGVASYPAAGWQPGRPAMPEEFYLPYASLRARQGARGKTALPVGGLAYPVLSKVGNDVPGTTNADADRITRLLETYTPAAQADYLMRSTVLAYAQNAPQIFWNALRDDQAYESIEPVNPDFGSGLLQRDFTPRPAFAAYRTLVNQIAGRTFVGAYAAGPDIVALVFEKDIESSIALWSPTGKGRVLLNSKGTATGDGATLVIATRADSKVLDSAGVALGGADGPLQLGTRPLWITKAGAAAVQAARANGPKFKLVSPPDTWTEPFGARAEFRDDVSGDGGEQGIAWRKYLDFRAAAVHFDPNVNDTGLVTETARNPLRPGDGRFFIFMDVDDDYMFFERGAPVEVTVTVKRLPPEVGSIVKHEGGFNIEYDAASGVKSTPWQEIEEGEGWLTFKYRLPDASFTNRSGYDLCINTFGSKRDLVFGSVTVKKLNSALASGVPEAPAAASTN